MRDPLPPPDVTAVTGAGGWLGQTLVHRLSDSTASGRGPDHLVRALVQHDDATAATLRALDGVQVVTGDVTRPADLDRLLDGLSGVVDVVHTAGVIHPARLAQFFAVNASGTQNVLDAARRARPVGDAKDGVRRIVHVSSNSPFGTNAHRTDLFRADEPFHPYLGYGRSKMMAELAVRAEVEAGLDAVIVRPPWFYGPWQPPRQTRFFRMIRTGRFPVFGDGGQRRSMVYVGNLVDGVLRAELRGRTGQAYWIADRRPYEVNEIVSTVQQALRDEGLEVSSRVLRVPALVSNVAELGDRALQRIGRYQSAVHVLGEMSKTIACDISASVADLGYEPEVDLLEGMRRSIRWCLDQGLEL
ncbi:MAG: NAD-dependent epimerase/dehydratase family protein [Acidimicrobiia bacterium]